MSIHSLPHGWEVAELGEIAQLVRGITFPTTAKRFGLEPGLVACLRTANVQTTVEWEDLWYVPIEYVKHDEQYVCESDILISTANSYELVGKVARVVAPKMPSTLGAFISLIRANAGISPAYLFYQLLSENCQREIRDMASTTTNISNVSGAKLKTLKLAVPPSAEQTRIVDKLDEVFSDLDAGVKELKTAQKKLTQYRQSLLKAAVEGTLTADWRTKRAKRGEPIETGTQLLERILRERRARWEARQLAKFHSQGSRPPKEWQEKFPAPVLPDTRDLPELPGGWAWASVEQVASDERYSLSIGPFGSNLKVEDYRNSGVPLVFVRNIRSGKYGGVHTKYVTHEKAIELIAHSVAPADVLVTKMGEPPGDADVYPGNQPPAIITADCIKIRCSGELMSPYFLKAVINSYIGRRQIEPMTQGVAQKKVSLGRFGHLAVPVPPADEQALIVRMISEAQSDADTQMAAIEFSLSQSAAQRKNILKAAFSGQLVPQEPNDEPAQNLLERIRIARATNQGVANSRGRKPKALA